MAAKRSVSAKKARAMLQAGNRRFMSDSPELVRRDRSRRKELAGGQSPFAIVLSCADSRVVPELAFDTGLGELFVVRVAGNVANTSAIASIEYAVAHLGVKLIVVLGHEACGAVQAAMGGGDNGYNLNHLLAHLAPALGGKSVDGVVRKNAKLTAKALEARSEILAKARGLEIAPAYYKLKDGKVSFL